MNELTLELDENPSEDELRELVDGVRIYNRAITGHERPRAVACFCFEYLPTRNIQDCNAACKRAYGANASALAECEAGCRQALAAAPSR